MANFHKKAFDPATQVKLDIYQKYVENWLPTFIKSEKPRSINIYDFFCGPGKDKEGRLGSPLLAIESCKKFDEMMREDRVQVNFFFNDSMKSKVAELEKNLHSWEIPPTIQCKTSNRPFTAALVKELRTISSGYNLLFLDQCGIKEITEDVFKVLVDLPRTDFMFFIASTYLRRFRESQEFKRYLDATDVFSDDLPSHYVHRAIAGMYRDMIPEGSRCYLAPFTIKKGSNIYGLIFGSSHLIGLEKFLRIVWSIDRERGEANFDIDSDFLPGKGDNLDLFNDNDKSSKESNFQEDLEKLVREGKFKTDFGVFKHSLEAGFLPTRSAKPVLMKLKKSGVIDTEGQLRLSKDCINGPRKIIIR